MKCLIVEQGGPLLTGLSSILQIEEKMQDSACVSDGVVYDG